LPAATERDEAFDTANVGQIDGKPLISHLSVSSSIFMKLSIELEQEADGRWIAEVPELRGVLVYGDSQVSAAQAARAMAFRVLADQIENGELQPAAVDSVSFAA